MKRVDLSIPEFAFVVATRATLGAGIGLLLGNRLGPTSRRNVGLALITLGALTTIPAVMAIRGRGFTKRFPLFRAA